MELDPGQPLPLGLRVDSFIEVGGEGATGRMKEQERGYVPIYNRAIGAIRRAFAHIWSILGSSFLAAFLVSLYIS